MADPGLRYAITDLEALVRLLGIHDEGHPLVDQLEAATAAKNAAIEAQDFERASALRDNERRLQKRIIALTDKVADTPVMHRLARHGLVDLDSRALVAGRVAFPLLTDAGRRLAQAERDRLLH